MSRYFEQKCANILAFHTANRFEDKRIVLESLCREMNSRVCWALSMSSSLFFEGIWDDFNDYDILISMEDVEEFEMLFTKLGGEINHNTIQKEAFTSPYYKEAVLGGIQFDLIGDITINTYNTTYFYNLVSEEINWCNLDRNINVPISAIEANFILYWMMCGWQSRRMLKRDCCKDFLKQEVRRPEILRKAMLFKLPEELQKNILILLNG